MKIYEFWLRFHLSLFPMVQLKHSSIGSCNGLVPNRQQAITWTNAYPVHWRMYAAFGVGWVKIIKKPPFIYFFTISFVDMGTHMHFNIITTKIYSTLYSISWLVWQPGDMRWQGSNRYDFDIALLEHFIHCTNRVKLIGLCKNKPTCSKNKSIVNTHISLMRELIQSDPIYC